MPALTQTLTAASCPAPMGRNAFLSLQAATVSYGNAPVASHILNDTVNLPRFNRNFAAQDMMGAYGGGIYAVAQGLALSAGTGLTLQVASGTALIDGVVDVSNITTPQTAVATARTIVCPNNATRYVWLMQNATLSLTSTTTPPSAYCCYLGRVVTLSGAITGLDTSGVMMLKGGFGIRLTADTAGPLDTPPAYLMFFTKTPTANYLWDGVEHLLIGGTAGGNPPHPIRTITANSTVVSGDEAIWIDATSGNVTLTLLDATTGPVKVLTVNRRDASGHTVTVTAAGSDLINGSASITLTAQYMSRTLRAGQTATSATWGLD